VIFVKIAGERKREEGGREGGRKGGKEGGTQQSLVKEK
jgi:hypothetical protein